MVLDIWEGLRRKHREHWGPKKGQNVTRVKSHLFKPTKFRVGYSAWRVQSWKFMVGRVQGRKSSGFGWESNVASSEWEVRVGGSRWGVQGERFREGGSGSDVQGWTFGLEVHSLEVHPLEVHSLVVHSLEVHSLEVQGLV